jgi:hypothetical protein
MQNGGSAVPAKLPDGSANPYAAVLTGLQSLLDGPLFKGQQPSEEAIAAATGAALRAAQHHAAADDAEQEAAEEEEEAEEVATASAPVSSSARSPPGSRRPRKRQAASSQVGSWCGCKTVSFASLRLVVKAHLLVSSSLAATTLCHGCTVQPPGMFS